MIDGTEDSRDGMGEFHNALVDLIDGSGLTPSEVCMVLDLHSTRIRNLFYITLQNQTTTELLGI